MLIRTPSVTRMAMAALKRQRGNRRRGHADLLRRLGSARDTSLPRDADSDAGSGVRGPIRPTFDNVDLTPATRLSLLTG